jgi:hypothetical protein
MNGEMSGMPEWERRIRWAVARWPPELQPREPATPEEWEARMEGALGEMPEEYRAAAREKVSAVEVRDGMAAAIAMLCACPEPFRESAAQEAEESVERLRVMMELARPAAEFDEQLRKAGVGDGGTCYREYWEDFQVDPPEIFPWPWPEPPSAAEE